MVNYARQDQEDQMILGCFANYGMDSLFSRTGSEMLRVPDLHYRKTNIKIFSVTCVEIRP